MKNHQLKNIAYKIKGMGEAIKKELGCGFDESIYQNALAIEFRKNKIKFYYYKKVEEVSYQIC